MTVIISDILKFLCCPDDGSEVALQNGFLECLACKRKYTILADNFFEILPSKFPKWDLKNDESQKAEKIYLHEFNQQFSWDKTTGGWGDLVNARPGTRAFHVSHRNKILELLHPLKNGVAIDVSGAVGNYSIFLADKVQVMVNCDLHTPSIITAFNRKKNNMLCVRAPYLRLPFSSRVFDYAICTDTLIRGWNHEMKLLAEIIRILKVGGKAIIDFHNQRWFTKNRNICRYTKVSIERLFSVIGIKKYFIYPFGYVPTRLVLKETSYSLLNGLACLSLPCQRYIAVFTKT